MRVQNWMLPMAGLLGTLAVVVAVLVAMGGTSEGSDRDQTSAQERCAAGAEACDDTAGGDALGTCLEGAEDCDDTGGGGNALGICIEGAVDCVDTVVNPNGDASDGGDQSLADGDQPVSSDTNSGDLGDPNDCSAVQNVETCEAKATELALADLSGRIGVEIEAITVVSVEPATWDGCLGIPPAEGEACTEIGILGYKIILEHAGTAYEYHTDSGAQAVLFP